MERLSFKAIKSTPVRRGIRKYSAVHRIFEFSGTILCIIILLITNFIYQIKKGMTPVNNKTLVYVETLVNMELLINMKELIKKIPVETPVYAKKEILVNKETSVKCQEIQLMRVRKVHIIACLHTMCMCTYIYKHQRDVALVYSVYIGP